MADEGVADHYQVLEELGREYRPPTHSQMPTRHCLSRRQLTKESVPGGSFGVVYKAIEKATGETVAIKHVSGLSPKAPSAEA